MHFVDSFVQKRYNGNEGGGRMSLKILRAMRGLTQADVANYLASLALLTQIPKMEKDN